MTEQFIKRANEALSGVSDTLDISESNFKLAEERYKAIGTWLERPESKVAMYKPLIHPQGSFRLGTVTKPISNNDKYDIDLVCVLQIAKDEMSQSELKDLVGDELKLYSKAYNMHSEPEEGKRCWKMVYADGVKFHMDILPAIPENDEFVSLLKSAGVNAEWAKHAIAITDNTKSGYHSISPNWEKSNPKGYALWFEDRMRVVAFNKRKSLVEKRVYAKIEAVPTYALKTPLQKVIQILKRHRDIMFGDDKDKPISIIISTLAALSYNNEETVVEALVNIVNKMDQFLLVGANGTEVPNPVYPSENFADKWPREPQKETKFKQWLSVVKMFVNNASNSGDFDQFFDSIKSKLGTKVNESSTILGAPAVVKREPRTVKIDNNPVKSYGKHRTV